MSRGDMFQKSRNFWGYEVVNMKKEVIKRGLFGFPVGIAIGFVITIIISAFIGDGVFYPVTPGFAETVGTELGAVVLQTVFCGIMGCGLAAVVIGEAIISKLPQNFAIRLTGVAIGAVIYYIVYQVIIFLGLDTDLLKMLSAVVVAIFLGTPYVKRKIASRRGIKKEGKKNA